MKCRDARQRWHSRLDQGGLDAELDRHLAGCEKCRAYAARMQRLVGLMDELRVNTDQLAPPVTDAGFHSALRSRRAWPTPGARQLMRIAATIVVVVGATLWFRTPKTPMVVSRTTEAAAPSVQGITLRAESIERFIAVAAPSNEPNVQTFWLYPMVTVAESRDRS